MGFARGVNAIGDRLRVSRKPHIAQFNQVSRLVLPRCRPVRATQIAQKSVWECSMKFAATTLVALFGVTSASAADLAPRSYTKTPVAKPGHDWSGFYAGAVAGYGWGSAPAAEAPASGPLGAFMAQFFGRLLPTALSPRMSNGVGGGEIGFNWQFDRIVAGFETDISSGMRGQDSLFVPPSAHADGMITTQSNRLDWLGTARAWVGWQLPRRCCSAPADLRTVAPTPPLRFLIPCLAPVLA